MRINPGESGRLAELVDIVWPGNTREELISIIDEYIDSDDSAVFAEEENGEYVGAAITWRAAKRVPSATLKASASRRASAAGELRESSCWNASSGRAKRAVRNSPATAS